MSKTVAHIWESESAQTRERHSEKNNESFFVTDLANVACGVACLVHV